MPSTDTVSLYRRRPKPPPPPSPESTPSHGGGSPQPADAGNASQASTELVRAEKARLGKPSRRKDRSSWIDRSLSSRKSTNTMIAVYGFPSSVSNNAKASRIKRVSAPASFVKEQRTYFAEIDAFELEEETPPSKERWMNDSDQRDTVIIPGVEFYSRGFLQAVDEDSPGKTTSRHIDILSEILDTPYSDKAKAQNYKPAGPSECLVESREETRPAEDIKEDGIPLTQSCCNSKAECELMPSDTKQLRCDYRSLNEDDYSNYCEEKVSARNHREDSAFHSPCGARKTALSLNQNWEAPEADLHVKMEYEKLATGNHREDASLCSPCDSGKTALSLNQNWEAPEANHHAKQLEYEALETNSLAQNCSNSEIDFELILSNSSELQSGNGALDVRNFATAITDDIDGKMDAQESRSHRFQTPCSISESILPLNQNYYSSNADCEPEISNNINCELNCDKSPGKGNTALTCSQDCFVPNGEGMDGSGKTMDEVINLDTPESKPSYTKVKQVKQEHSTPIILDTPECKPIYSKVKQVKQEDSTPINLDTPECKPIYTNPKQVKQELTNSGDLIEDLTNEMKTLHVQDHQVLEHHYSPERIRDIEISCGPIVLDVFLEKCGQKAPLKLREAIVEFSDMKEILKLGEGTYGEAFKGNNAVFKIVPMNGDLLVNGETQKTLTEMYTETLLTLTLNRLRGVTKTDMSLQLNICNNFIETKKVRVCQGVYDKGLINAWEKWDDKHGSENDHPKHFPADQLYVLFVLADGGKDLESFPVKTYDVARSILMQVTVALAVAEEDCEFEHRDLHWGNILVSHTQQNEVRFRLDGRDMLINAHGVFVQIIDFTLSRLYTGTEVLFADLSADPALFEGCKGDVQAETYRRMLQVTKGQWGSSFFRTNCHWLHYLVEILVTKKLLTQKQKLNQEIRELRAFKKRIMSYDSAKTCLLEDKIFASVRQQNIDH